MPVSTKTDSTAAMQTPKKRKVLAAGLSTDARNVKRRASKACQCCRSRKVRCDVVENGIPCTNCRLDRVQCTVPEGKRRRKSHIDCQLDSSSSSSNNNNNASLSPASASASAYRNKDLSVLPIFRDVDVFSNITFVTDGVNVHSHDQMGANLPHQDQKRGQGVDQEHTRRTCPVEARKPALLSLDLSNQRQFLPVLPVQDQTSHGFDHPQYLRPVPQHILNADLSYLSSRGALQIPDTRLRNELLRCYVQYVHPYLPLLNLQDFIPAIQRNDGRNPISLLLFQAVMFAGTGFIDMAFLEAEGFDTRKAARQAFFRRVKLLYDFDYELDRVIVVQAVLLMTYWYEAPDNQKDIWHWLGIAISLGSTIGINNDNSRSSLSPETQRLWKRIWWCCYLRDRLISLGMRRPLHIRDKDFSVGMLELQDFETERLSVEDSSLLGDCPAVHDTCKRVTLAKLCLALINLCKCVAQVLDVQYCLMGQKIGETKNTTVRLVPKQSLADSSDVLRCDRALEEWHLSTPLDLHYFQPHTISCANSKDDEVIYVHRSLLTGIYLTTLSALHRPYTLASTNEVTIAPGLKERSVHHTREAANKIADMYSDLCTHDLIRYLPNTAVSILLPALIIHFLDLKSQDAILRQASTRRFQICLSALHRLREMYASADFAFSIVDTLVRRAQIEIPITFPPEPRHSKCSSLAGSSSLIDGCPVTNLHSPLPTPPPEVTWTAKRLLFSSTLAPEERKLIAAFAGQDNPTVTSEGVGLERVLPLNTPDLDPIALSEVDDQSECSKYYACDEKETQPDNDFDSLINLEGYGNVGAADESGIFAEMNLAWLNGMDMQNGDEQTLDLHEEEDHDSKENAGGDNSNNNKTRDDSRSITASNGDSDGGDDDGNDKQKHVLRVQEHQGEESSNVSTVDNSPEYSQD